MNTVVSSKASNEEFFKGAEFTSFPGHLHFRFFAQYMGMGEMAWSNAEFSARIIPFFEGVLPELAHAFNTHERLVHDIRDYKAGIQDGRYLKVDHKGRTEHNRSKEREIQASVKSLFVSLKRSLVLTFKSGVLSDTSFDAQRFYFCDANKLNQRLEEYLRQSDGRYKPLVQLLIKANRDFLSTLKEIRDDVEHDPFTVDAFTLEKAPDGYFVAEPILDGKLLSETIEHHFNRVFDLIEKLIAYFIGINVERKHTRLELHVGREVDYLNSKNRFIIAPTGARMWYPTDKCLYD